MKAKQGLPGPEEIPTCGSFYLMFSPSGYEIVFLTAPDDTSVEIKRYVQNTSFAMMLDDACPLDYMNRFFIRLPRISRCTPQSLEMWSRLMKEELS